MRTLRAAFKNGDEVIYTGTRKVWTEIKGKMIPIIEHGMKVKIIETWSPHNGYGFIKNDEDGEPIIDRDEDGYNVYQNEFGMKRIIWPRDKHEWSLITTPKAEGK